MRGKCDACDSVTINGVYCHETGCYRAAEERRERMEEDSVSFCPFDNPEDAGR